METDEGEADLPAPILARFGPAPAVPTGSLPQRVVNAVETAFVEPFAEYMGPRSNHRVGGYWPQAIPAWGISPIYCDLPQARVATQLNVAASIYWARNCPVLTSGAMSPIT